MSQILVSQHPGSIKYEPAFSHLRRHYHLLLLLLNRVLQLGTRLVTNKYNAAQLSDPTILDRLQQDIIVQYDKVTGRIRSL